MIKKLALSAFALVSSLGSPLLAQDSAAPQKAAVEFNPRGGLPNFLAKLKAGQPVKVGYLGGSITAQKGWRVKSLAWLQDRYPSAKLTEINAAIGGTGSDLGVFRIERDVLQAKPDLLFVEFAVNDSKAPPENIRKAMEGIVRKTWQALPDCDICFVYTVIERDISDLQAGKMKTSESVMEDIADFYKIPSVHFGLEIADLARQGKLVMSSPDAHVERVSGDELNEIAQLPVDEQGRVLFSKDGVHPYLDTGHVLYMKALARALEKLEGVGKAGPHELKAPLHANNWEKAKFIPLDITPTEGLAEKLDPASNSLARTFSGTLPVLWSLKPGAEIRLKFRGTKASLYQLMGPDCGSVEVVLDQGPARKFNLVDSYCSNHRLNVLPLGDNLADGEHEVTVKVLDTPLDKAKILSAQNAEDLTKNPAKYDGLNWYTGAIFLVGDLIDVQVAP